MTSSTSPATKPPRDRAGNNAPHSWELETWPADVWPHEPKRASWVIRAYRGELVEAGALTRIGKRLVIIGSGYSNWQKRRARHVVEFTSNNAKIGKRAVAADEFA
jgi:hypothetical protein